MKIIGKDIVLAVCRWHVMAIMLSTAMISGCGFGISGGRISFDDLQYPVSMSNSLYGPNGEIVRVDERLKAVKEFTYVKDHASIFYSLIPLTATGAIASQMNKEIKDAGGDGMVNVRASSSTSGLTDVFPLSMLPIWPGSSEIRIQGTIVKLVE